MARRASVAFAALLAVAVAPRARAARPLSNFPVVLDGPIRTTPAVGEIDGDGRMEIVTGAGGRLVAVDDDGKIAAGFPYELGGALAGPPALSDIDGDGSSEILAVTRAGGVYLLKGNGEAAAGFPLHMGPALAGGAFLDLDGDGRAEVVAGDAKGRLYAWRVDADGPHRFPGFPRKVGDEISSAPVLADLGSDEARWVLFVGTASGAVHAVAVDGKPVAGFPLRTKYRVSGPPAVGDLDDDGRFDLVVTSQDYSIYAVGPDARAHPGFPYKAGYRIYGGAALADLDGDDRLEIVAASADRNLHVLKSDGTPLTGFPVKLSDTPEASPVVGDIDGDGRLDIVVPTVDGKVHAFRSSGRRLSGWPVKAGTRIAGAAVLADVVGDGRLEVVVGTQDGSLAVYRPRRRRRSRSGLAPWPTEAHDMARTGRMHPNPTRFKALAIAPEAPDTTQDLHATWVRYDLDREPPKEIDLRWWRNGKEVPALVGQRTVPASETRKGQRWRFTVQVPGDQPVAPRFESPEITIRNAVPTPPAVAIEPKEPHHGEGLVARIVEPGRDPDGDAIRYLYTWYVDGREAGLPKRAAKVPPGRLRKGQVWRVVVRSSDGSDRSDAAEASVVVVNTPPTQPKIRLLPDAPRVTDVLRVRIVEAARDVDGDALSYLYRWEVDGAPAPLAHSVSEAPAGTFRKGQRVTVTVSAWDGENEGEASSASRTVSNSPPEGLGVAIAPEAPRTGEPLQAVLDPPADDADGDRVTYRWTWTVDGVSADVEGPEVPAERVRAGQQWQVRVVPADDETTGTPAEAKRRVVNTAPEAPAIAIDPPQPAPEEPLSLRIVHAASDRDGDAVALKVEWKREGKVVYEGERLPGGRTRKGERWTVSVTPSDGALEGAPSEATVVIGNRPPPPPGLHLRPEVPTGGQALVAEVERPVDPDGDAVRLELRWQRDGRPVPDLNDAVRVPPQQVKKGAHWVVRVRAGDGTAWSDAVTASVVVGDRPPVAPAARIRPKRPRTEEALTCRPTAEARDPDGDPTVVRYLWMRGDEAVGSRGKVLPAAATRKGETWRCRVRVHAGGTWADGAPSPPVTVANTAPTAPKVEIEPKAPHTGEPLRCGIRVPASDADGDALQYRYRWERNGKRVQLRDPVVPGERVHKGDRWRCVVRAEDGEATSDAAEAVVTVVNKAPGSPEVRIVPSSPRAGETLRCEVVEDATDPDGDRVTYQFRWYLDGALQPFAPTSVAVKGRLVKAGQRWVCAAVAEDGEAEGPERRSREVRVLRGGS